MEIVETIRFFRLEDAYGYLPELVAKRVAERRAMIRRPVNRGA
jgi:hypothetical protein